MKLRHLIFVVFVVALSNLAQAQENCRVVERVNHGYSPVKPDDIVQPGKYCLKQDVKIPRLYSISEGGERGASGSVMLVISTSNVEFDLQGFTMNADMKGMPGIKSGYWRNPQSEQKITIRNGVLKSRSASAIEFNMPNGSLLSDFKRIYTTPGFAEDELQKLLKTLPQSADAYQKTEYLIERMKIESESVSHYVGIHRKTIGMKGASNIIRNSTIEVTDGHAAIYLFGPNQLIENNIIIFKGKAAVESAAAIKLHQADGSIIRNNDIIIESSDDDAPKAAISLIDSKDVVIEGNRIYGIKTLTHNWDEKSSSVEKNNEFRSMLRRPWATGTPGVH